MEFPEIEASDAELTAQTASDVGSTGGRQPRSERGDVDDDPIATTRRRVLGGVAGAAAAGLAGCSSLTGGGGGGGDTDWAEWVPAELVDTDRSGAQAGHFDLSSLYEEFPSSYTADAEFGAIAQQLGLSEGDIEGAVSISESDTTSHAVLLGSFSGSTVTDNFPVEASTYEGYDVLDGQLAVDDGVVVAGGAYQSIVDAKEGDATTLLEAEGEWSAAVENASSGTITAVEPADSENAWEVSGIAASGGEGTTVAMTAYAHFAAADAAEANRDAVEEDVTATEDPDDTQMEVDSVSVEGSVVVVEGTTQADEL